MGHGGRQGPGSEEEARVIMEQVERGKQAEREERGQEMRRERYILKLHGIAERFLVDMPLPHFLPPTPHIPHAVV